MRGAPSDVRRPWYPPIDRHRTGKDPRRRPARLIADSVAGSSSRRRRDSSQLADVVQVVSSP